MADGADSYKKELNFYEKYEIYLNEPRVRKVHDVVLGAVLRDPSLQQVIDLGCGKSNEFLRWGVPAFYAGIDANADPARDSLRDIIVGDYRQPGQVEALIKKHKSTAVVSLFSAENTAPRNENHTLFEDLFRNTDIKTILVAGFYYEHAKGEEIVIEEGGHKSYQTPGTTAGRANTLLFNETRIEVPCPSDRWGEDVMEVWRLLQKPGHDDKGAAVALSRLVPPHAASTMPALTLAPSAQKKRKQSGPR